MRRHVTMAQAGFTLTELLIVSGLTLIVSGLMFACAIYLSDFWHLATTRLDLRLEAQQAVARMTAELQSATRTDQGGSPPNLSIPAAPANDRVQFYLPKDVDGNGLIIDATGAIEWDQATPIQYQYVPGLKLLRRLAGGNQTVLANGVTSVAFSDQSITPALFVDEVRIQLTLQRAIPRQRTVSADATAIVKLRN